ncbi:unnamed protein product [Didymodactylos carnosus]|nr:unnamed protein product [Didymodactylos carnosus]CAF4302222.1 unnamed protein product [Didymodactylos carnosus]
MCVLQDFEALTPNLLARTIETVEGGGLVILLLRSMKSLKQLYTMTMDIHSRYRTESHSDLVGRFNERFILSLSSCQTCIVVDDQLNLLPVSSSVLNIQSIPAKTEENSLTPNQIELKKLCDSLKDTQPVGSIIECCKTFDQAKIVLKFIDLITDKSLRHTAVLTAARGRGKSAALGLAMSAAIGFGYSNIYVTSPSPENLKTLFEFIFKGFDSMDYQEHIDYDTIQSTNSEFNKAIIRVNIFRQHRQTIQYIHPSDSAKLGQCELLVIDEAAAIPLPLVKNLLGPYLVFLSSTINGYEEQLRQQSTSFSSSTISHSVDLGKQSQTTTTASGRTLTELELNEPIRYGLDDPVEYWLNNLLCLNCCQDPFKSGLNLSKLAIIRGSCPSLDQCSLYYINRDTLFSYHSASEAFLKRLIYLFVSSHYKNSPNDLQLLSDAPAHDLYCLLGPIDSSANNLPDILCAIQVCFEGELNKDVIKTQLQHGKRASGDLIPWTITQEYQDYNFGKLSGVRIVRIATNPDYQRMGYGTKALELLEKYFQGYITNLDEDNEQKSSNNADEIELINDDDITLLNETIVPRTNLPPLLTKLQERKPEQIDYMGVSFGLTSDLLKFWKKNAFIPVYLRQAVSDLTGEHSCIMLKVLHEEKHDKGSSSWLYSYYQDFRRRFLSLLSFQFRTFLPGMALNILQQTIYPEQKNAFTTSLLYQNFIDYDLKRMEAYSRNLVDYHLIIDLIPSIAQLYYSNKLQIQLNVIQMAILVAIGLQRKTIENLEQELNLPQSQLLALFNKIIKKTIEVINTTQEAELDVGFVKSLNTSNSMQPLDKSLQQELKEVTATIRERQSTELDRIMEKDLAQYSVKGHESLWQQELKNVADKPGVVSIPRTLAKRKDTEIESHFKDATVSKKHKKKKIGMNNKKF